MSVTAKHRLLGAPLARRREVARVLLLVLFANLAVAVAKLVFGAMVGAVALFADGLHSLLDTSSNVVGLVGLYAGAKPPDREHPYGHRRFETLAAVTIGLLIVMGLAAILSALVLSFMGASAEPRPTPLAAAVVAATAAINMLVSRIEARRGEQLKSAILTADAAHSASDALASIVVLVSFAGVAIGWPWADSVAAIFVALLIARTAWRVLRDNFGVLVDRAPLDPVKLAAIATGVPGVLRATGVRSRGLTDYAHVDLTIHLAPETTLVEAHRAASRVSQAIEAEFHQVADVVVQTAPDLFGEVTPRDPDLPTTP